MKKIVLISAVFLFLVGCGLYEVEAPGGPNYMSLDEALAQAREPYTYYDERGNVPYLYDLERLREQAISEKDKAIIDQKMAEYRQRAAVASQQWIRQQGEERKERERLEHEQAERERIEFETKRKELIQNSNGTLRDKSAEQVKKLVDRWKEGSWRWEKYSKFFSVETFYEVFGKPDRKQFLSSGNEWQSSYYFLYNCKDGVVQIKVRASQLDDNAIVIVEDLNIF